MPNILTSASSWLGAGLSIAILAAPPALANPPIQKRALPGQTVMLDGYASDDGPQANCRSQPASVGVVKPPVGGRLSQRYETMVLGNVVNGDRGSPCIRRPKSAAALYYTARHGFSGVDRVTVDVRFANGGRSAFTYLVTVEAPPEQAAPAQAARPQPRNDEYARPAERLAPIAAPQERPASEARNASDFLSRVARDGQRAPVPAEGGGAPVPQAKAAPDTLVTPGLQPAAPAEASAGGRASETRPAEPPPSMQLQQPARPPVHGPQL